MTEWVKTVLLPTILLWAAGCGPALAVNTTTAGFVSKAFNQNPPEVRTLWITGDLRDKTTDILGHAPPALRTRYWIKDDTSVWILEETGKEQPITTGLVVREGRLTELEILVYRESRGWEIKRPAFRQQFYGATLADDTQLDRNIDGISGATLSVRAMRKLARLALLYDAHVRSK